MSRRPVPSPHPPSRWPGLSGPRPDPCPAGAPGPDPAPRALPRRQLLGLPLAWGLGGLLGTGLAGCALPRGAAPAPGGHDAGAVGRAVPAFSQAPAEAELPAGWAPYVLRRHLPQTHYRLAELDGRRVLHARAEHASSALQCRPALDLEPLHRPRLRWSWRADRLVGRGARVDDDQRDDAVARIGLGFDGPLERLPLRDYAFHERVQLFTGVTLPFQSLLYTWDDELPVGSVWSYRRSSAIRYLVVQSGPAGLGRWTTHERDLIADHRRVFPESADRPVGRLLSLGCFTDSDDLGGVVEAWYGDLSLRLDA